VEQIGFKSGVKGRGSDRWCMRAKMGTVMRAGCEVNRNEVAGN